MKKLLEILKKYKKPFIWTLCYIFLMWAVLYYLFNFNIFNDTQWHRLAHAQLRGFPGFVFGILLLVALPLYVATTVITARKNEYLISLPAVKLPQLKKHTPKPAPEPEKSSTEPEQKSDTPEISPDVPREIRGVYIRALRNIESLNFETAPTPTPETSVTPDATEDPFPLPADFDISFADTPGYDTPDESDSVPVFTDISFDNDDTATPQTSAQTPEYTFDNSAVIAHLDRQGQKYVNNNNVITTDKLSIITHSDPDFWVTDSDTWFATGKSCPSPVQIVKSVATQNGTTPVLYLASTNIMDLETLAPQWESDGIMVITDINKL